MKKKSYLELTPSQRREERRQDVFKSVQKRRELIDLGMPKEEAKKSLNTIITRAGPQGFDRTDIMIMDKEIIKRQQDARREAALNANPLLEKRQIRNKGGDIEEYLQKVEI